MKYDKPLPPVRELLGLAQSVSFPITQGALGQAAQEQGRGKAVLDFLGLYPAGEVFNSKVDFMTRSEELLLFITQDQDTPEERLRSPQD